MTNQLWYEMVNIKYGEIYLSMYIALQRSLKKVFQIMTIVISLSGVLSWKYFEDYVWVAFVLIAIVQLILLVENQLIRSDQEIEELLSLKMMYTKYCNKLEGLWTNYQADRITESEAMDKYYSYRDKDWVRIERLDGKLNVKRFKRLMNRSDEEMNNYLIKYS